MSGRASHALELAFVRVTAWLAQRLPAGAARGLARAFGDAAWTLGLRREVTRANLAIAFPEKPVDERDAIAREAYRQAAMSAFEILRTPLVTAEELDRIAARIDGIEHVAAARAHGKGAVLVGSHFGAFELGGAVVARLGHPVHFFVRGQSNRQVDAFLQERRGQLGVQVVRHGVGVREALRALRANECVALVADQDAGRRGTFVEFFGRPASTPPGPAEFSVRTGAPLIVGYVRRNPDGTYDGHFEPPILPPDTGDREADVRTLTQAHTRLLERWIREFPEQWLWSHRRWKSRPATLAAVVLAAVVSAQAGATPSPTSPDTSLALPVGRPGESAFDGAGSSVFPLTPSRVRRVFEGVRITREKTGWRIEAEEIFQAGVAPQNAAMGLPDYRASLASSDSARATTGTVRDLEVTVDGLPMAVTELPGSAAPGQDLGGIERVFRWEVPFSAEEIRTVRLAYSIGESKTDGGEPLLFFYLNPGSLWEGEGAKVTVAVDLGDVNVGDVIPGWLRPRGARIYGSQVIWRRRAGDEVEETALAFRPDSDPLAAFADRAKGPLGLSFEAREEWFERLTVRELHYFADWLRARRGAPASELHDGAAFAHESWYHPSGSYRPDRLAKDEKALLVRIDARLAEWKRAEIPLAPDGS